MTKYTIEVLDPYVEPGVYLQYELVLQHEAGFCLLVTCGCAIDGDELEGSQVGQISRRATRVASLTGRGKLAAWGPREDWYEAAIQSP